MALIAGIYSTVYAPKPVNKTAALVAKARPGKSGAARRSRKAARRAGGKA